MKVLKNVNLKDILFIDIETSTTTRELKINSSTFNAWAYSKRKNNETDDELISMYAEQAALYSDFGRVICISVGKISGNKLHLKTFNNLDETQLIIDFYEMLDKFTGEYLCGHNIKSFDIPYIAKRGMINSLLPHALLDTSGEKPWTMNWLLDTKELWQMGGYDWSSLLSLTNALGIESSKEDLQGKDVPKCFWENPEGNIQRISDYCERDVIAVYKVINHLKSLGKEKPLIHRLFDGGDYGKAEQAELKKIFDDMDEEQRDLGYNILNSVISTSKEKKTKITKADVKALKESYT